MLNVTTNYSDFELSINKSLCQLAWLFLNRFLSSPFSSAISFDFAGARLIPNFGGRHHSFFRN